MFGIKTTKQHSKYWKDRKIDWKTSYFDTFSHPHRALLVQVLKSIPFYSLWEVGVGGGANIMRFVQEIPNRQYGGSDVSEDAVKFCLETFKGGLFHVESAEDMMMSDKSVDVVLSDMCMIYFDPLKIDKALQEIKRVGRTYAIFCEFHSNSWIKRQWARLGGYHVYDYRKRLEKLGYYDVNVFPLSEADWPGADHNTEFRSIITAKIPNRI